MRVHPHDCVQGRGAGSGAGDMDMPELESSSDSEDDEDNDLVRRSTFHLFYIVHRCTRPLRACACTASPQGTTGTANGEYMDPGPGPPKKHEVFWQYRDQRAEGEGPCATYKGFGDAQIRMDRLYPARDSFASRPMSNLPAYSDPMPASLTPEEVIIARSVFKLNRAEGARLHRCKINCVHVNQVCVPM